MDVNDSLRVPLGVALLLNRTGPDVVVNHMGQILLIGERSLFWKIRMKKKMLAVRAALLPYLTLKQVLMSALVLLAFAAFANAISGKFIYDDQRVVLRNPLLGHWDPATIKAIFTHDYWSVYNPQTADQSIDSLYYRPVYHLFTMAAYELAGTNAAGWHLISLLLHIAATLMALLVLEKTLAVGTALAAKERLLMAAFAAAIFAIHPAQGEAVAWISASANSLLAIFVFGACYGYLDYRERGRGRGLVIALFLSALAIFTKETAIVIPLIAAAYELVILNREHRLTGRIGAAVLHALPFAGIVAGYFVMRYAAMNIMIGQDHNLNFPEDASLTLIDNLRTLPALMLGYMKLALSPFNHSMMYDFGYVRSFSFTAFWLPLAAVLAVAAALVCLCRRMPEVKAALIWMVIPLLPHLNTRVFVSEEIIHDRYLYMSLAGFGLLVATFIIRAVRSGRLPFAGYRMVYLPAVVLLILLGGTVLQNKQWHDEEALWSGSADYAPNSRTVHLSLGILAEARGDYLGALHQYESVLETNPDVIDALNNAAFIYARHLGQWPQATRNFEHIVSLTPDKPVAHFNLSFTYAVQKRYADAEREQRAALELDPNGARADEWRNRLKQLQRTCAGLTR